MGSASKRLLSWRRTLNNDQQIERPELEDLLSRIASEEFSTTIILGAPGSGKSALMATLGHKLVAQGCTILAIKADQLNGSIKTIEDLQRDLQLPLSPNDAIDAVASREQIVVLIDQLDAVSELLDRRSERLSLLLSLIQQFLGKENVHVVATCREFEFRYGSQFARLAEIDQLDLSLPTWEKITPILEAAGHTPASMGAPLQELLQNPLHLDIFLDVAKPNEGFTSSQRLLDQLWEKRVNQHPQTEQAIDFLEDLADYMTKQEVLWVPAAWADRTPAIRYALEQAGLLIANQENGTIGFRHQTYYDHTLARGFARESQSLTDLVLDRQDGLFIRPILLRGLNYLRGTVPAPYHKQLTNLLHTYRDRVRPHIRTLLIEFLGAQVDPDTVEAGLLISLLGSETEGIKILDAVTGSPGWFRRLRDRPEFTHWLEKPPEQAVCCSLLLSAATSFAADDVWDLVRDYWLNDQSYDRLSVRILWNIDKWDTERVWFTQQIIQRSYIDWHEVAAIAEKIAEMLPNQASIVIRAHLDYLTRHALQTSDIRPPELLPNATEYERYLHADQYDPLKPLVQLVESEHNFYEIGKFAEIDPQSFLENLWPWFTDTIYRLTRQSSSFTIVYNQDRVGDFRFFRSEIIQAFLTATKQLSQQNRQDFLEFFNQNKNSELLIVHRILANALDSIASEEPLIILNYLLDDSRRFNLGGQVSGNGPKETERLISHIFPYLQLEDRIKLEKSICTVKHCQPSNEQDIELRRSCLRYNREHRLCLLRAIPEDCVSPEIKRLINEEDRALPWVALRKNGGIRTVQDIGPRMTKEEMSRASDHHLLKLFDKLSDRSSWRDFSRQGTGDISRSISAAQQSREFGKLVKEEPSRLLNLLPQLEPLKHESYIGAAVEDLAETNFSAQDLISIIEDLDQRGFVSEDFRSDAAHALEKIAKRNRGLPQSSLSLLKQWLSGHSQPEQTSYRGKEDQPSSLSSSILFGIRGSHVLPGGRGNIVRAIIEGYLQQNPPDLDGWAKFIESQLGVEPHPAVWVDILSCMLPLLNSDPEQATQLFDRVICNSPEVLQYSWSFYHIAHGIGWFKPQETVQRWLEMLRLNSSNFSQQVYGELLLVQYLKCQDEWSVSRIRQHLAEQDNEALLCGLAHAASHLWAQRECRTIATETLHTLAFSSKKSIQKAVSTVFNLNRDNFRVDRGMQMIIGAVCQNQELLLESADDLTDILEKDNFVDSNPDLVSEVCQSLVDIGIEITNPARRSAFIADKLTTIAIQLHRQPAHRDVGLHLFEALLAMNLKETQSALETLDRRPNRRFNYTSPRRRLRSRKKLT
ncbi:ATP-binding protein [Nodosilinea sp. LEGE 07298]|nr:ATP-binding protein [Nodosilinea sp. LEGE 07298]